MENIIFGRIEDLPNMRSSRPIEIVDDEPKYRRYGYNTQVDIELDCQDWTIDEVNAAIEKICSAHEGKHNLHLKISIQRSS